MSPFGWIKTGIAVVCVLLFSYMMVCLVRGGKGDGDFDA